MNQSMKMISSCAEKFNLVKDNIMVNIKRHDACFGRYDLDEDMLFEHSDSGDK